MQKANSQGQWQQNSWPNSEKNALLVNALCLGGRLVEAVGGRWRPLEAARE